MSADRETLLALLAEAREWIDPTESPAGPLLMARIDDTLATEPEARG